LKVVFLRVSASPVSSFLKDLFMKFWSNSDTPPSRGSIPEKKLFAAVLQRAITDFLTGDGEVQEGARQWIVEEECEGAPLTFSFICEALDIDANNLRKAVLGQRSTSTTATITNPSPAITPLARVKEEAIQ
jgi:hypothetical protein